MKEFGPDCELLYDGEKKDDMRWGYGKSFAMGDCAQAMLMYEGEWKDNTRWGKGKAYLPLFGNRLEYDGDWKDDQRHGAGRCFDTDGVSVQYDGQWQFNRPCGQGKEYDRIGMLGKVMTASTETSILRYDGEWGCEMTHGMVSNTYYHGYGKLYRVGGSLEYVGQWEYGRKNGVGTTLRPDGTTEYQGTWHGDVKAGFGISYGADGKTVEYDGQFRDDTMHGLGREYTEEGHLSYDGEWFEGARQGEGRLYEYDATQKTSWVSYSGTWKDDMFCGHGKSFTSNGRCTYEGQWSKSVRNGDGKLFYDDGRICYEGGFKDGMMCGYGKEFCASNKDVVVYDGMWWNDKRSGTGRWFVEGSLFYDGEFKDDMMWGNGTLYKRDGSTVENVVMKKGALDAVGTKRYREDAQERKDARRKVLDLYESVERLPDIGACPLCLESMLPGDEQYVYKCGHKVCGCVQKLVSDKWKSTCPTCRKFDANEMIRLYD